MQSALFWISIAALFSLGSAAGFFHAIVFDDESCLRGNCTSMNFEMNKCYIFNATFFGEDNSTDFNDTDSSRTSVMFKEITLNGTGGNNLTLGIALRFDYDNDDCSGSNTIGLPVRSGCIFGLLGRVDANEAFSNCTKNIEAEEAEDGSGGGDSGALLLAPSLSVVAAALTLLFSIRS